MMEKIVKLKGSDTNADKKQLKSFNPEAYITDLHQQTPDEKAEKNTP